MADNINDELLNELNKREEQSKFQYDNDPDVGSYEIPNWIDKESDTTKDTQPIGNQSITPQNNNLGKVNMNRNPLGMESEWKNIPVSNLNIIFGKTYKIVPKIFGRFGYFLYLYVLCLYFLGFDSLFLAILLFSNGITSSSLYKSMIFLSKI